MNITNDIKCSHINLLERKYIEREYKKGTSIREMDVSELIPWNTKEIKVLFIVLYKPRKNLINAPFKDWKVKI